MEKDKERILRVINSQFKRLQKEVLNTAELVIPSDKWDIFRKQVLDYVNDTDRRIQQEINDNYKVNYTPTTVKHDVVEITRPKKEWNGHRKKFNKNI